MEPTTNTTLTEQKIGEDEEYNINDKHWILVPNQLEEGSHIVVEETIDVNISDDLANPKIIQLGNFLAEHKKKLFISILK